MKTTLPTAEQPVSYTHLDVYKRQNLNACCPWLYIELSKIVDCIDEDFANLDEFCFGQLLCPGTSIVVPSNSCDWGY